MRKDGCIAVHDLLAHWSFKAFTEEDILVCIQNNPKDRFELIVEGNTSWVRARQGHNQEVAERIDEDSLHTRIALDTAPRIAIHGTRSIVLNKIRQEELKRFDRQYIHMATGLPSDKSVISGCRTGTDLFLYIDVPSAIRDGFEFRRSGNNVTQTPGINGVLPFKYILRGADKNGDVVFGTIPRSLYAIEARWHEWN